MSKRTRYYTVEFCKDKWKTRDGQILELKDMTKNHIINSLNMILRICNREHLNPNRYKIYNNLRKELKKDFIKKKERIILSIKIDNYIPKFK